jgi:hypothetical protein
VGSRVPVAVWVEWAVEELGKGKTVADTTVIRITMDINIRMNNPSGLRTCPRSAMVYITV